MSGDRPDEDVERFVVDATSIISLRGIQSVELARSLRDTAGFGLIIWRDGVRQEVRYMTDEACRSQFARLVYGLDWRARQAREAQDAAWVAQQAERLAARRAAKAARRAAADAPPEATP